MLKTTLAVGPVVGDEQDGKRIQVENQDEKEPTQKSRKSQRTIKSKKWIQAENQRPLELKTLVANQHRSLSPKQEMSLPNGDKHLSKRPY